MPATRGTRVFLFGNKGYASVVLQRLLDASIDVVGVCCQRRPMGRSRWKLPLARTLSRIGMYEADITVVGETFATQPGPEEIAARRGIAVVDSAALTADGTVDEVQRHAPTLLLSAGFHRLIPERLIDCVPAAINLHPALLPRHRGGTPCRWTIYHGDRETGVTAHLLTARFDEGDVVAQVRCEVPPGTTGGMLEEALAEPMARLAVEIAHDPAACLDRATPQDLDSAPYEPPLRGSRAVIDWRRGRDEIVRLAFALRPRSGAVTSHRGRRLYVWQLSRAEGDANVPGRIAWFDDGRPVVACGDGLLRVEQVVAGGIVKSPRRSRQWSRLAPGDVLGETAEPAC